MKVSSSKLSSAKLNLERYTAIDPQISSFQFNRNDLKDKLNDISCIVSLIVWAGNYA